VFFVSYKTFIIQYLNMGGLKP